MLPAPHRPSERESNSLWAVSRNFTSVKADRLRTDRRFSAREVKNIILCCDTALPAVNHTFINQQTWQALTNTLTRSPSRTRASVASLQPSMERLTVCFDEERNINHSAYRHVAGYLIAEPEAGFTRTLFLVCPFGEGVTKACLRYALRDIV